MAAARPPLTLLLLHARVELAQELLRRVRPGAVERRCAVRHHPATQQGNVNCRRQRAWPAAALVF